MVVKKKWRTFHSFQESKKHDKNSKKTTRRATSAIWRIFANVDKPKRTLSKMNLTSMHLGGCELPRPSASVDNTLLDLLNSSYPTAKYNTISTFTQRGTRTRCFFALADPNLQEGGGGRGVGHPDPEIRGLV